jgi:hypothetical protein
MMMVVPEHKLREAARRAYLTDEVTGEVLDEYGYLPDEMDNTAKQERALDVVNDLRGYLSEPAEYEAVYQAAITLFDQWQKEEGF